MSNIRTDRMYDEQALSAFEKAMGEKLAQKRDEGRGGWWDPDECTIGYLNILLHEHFNKIAGGPPSEADCHQLVDIANLAMFLWWRLQTEKQANDNQR